MIKKSHDNRKPCANNLIESLKNQDHIHNRERQIIGTSMILGAIAIGASIITGYASHIDITRSMPYLVLAQHDINTIDIILAKIGEVSFPLTLAALGVAKLKASSNPLFNHVDALSSKEMATDSNKPKRFGTILQKLFAGKLPIVAAIGVSLGSFSASVGHEVSNGPERPIRAALTKLLPGKILVVQDSAEQPMLDGSITQSLSEKIITIAHSDHIQSASFTKYLGTLTTSGPPLSTLEFGITVPHKSPLYWVKELGCRNIPVGIDRSARIRKGSDIDIDGVNAIVTSETSGMSAIGRTGVVMSEQAMRDCIEKEPNGPVYAVGIDTSLSNGKKILQQATGDARSPTVITKDHFIQNSLNFWEANVKPITNTMAVFSGLFALVAMSGAITGRLVRNKRELASMSAAGMKTSVIRGTEIMRAAKDSIVATVFGGIISLITPFIVNSLESGFKAGITLQDLGVGAAIGTIGCFGGIMKSMHKPHKIINVPENTRVG